MTTATHTQVPPRVALYQLATGHYLSQALLLATQLGLADLLAQGPRQAIDLAQATATHAPSLTRVLRLLASVEVFAEQADGAFALTPLSECLLAGGPGSVRPMVMLFAGNRHQETWKDLEHCVRTGKAVFNKHGLDGAFTDPAKGPEPVARFDAGMGNLTALAAGAIAAAYDFASLRSVVDVGGGNGALLIGILAEHPHLRGIVFDRAHNAQQATQRIAEQGLSERCEAVGGDFFAELPQGADAYLVKHVLHDWDDERAATILRNCQRAMAPSGRVLVIEGLYPQHIDQSLDSQIAVANDVNMLVSFGGRQRTQAEFGALFEAADLELTRVIATQARVSLIEGQRR